MSNPYDTAKERNSSVLGPTLKFKGELTADEDLLIQGRIEGSIKHSSSLTVGEGGHVKADVAAEYIAVEGRVEGDLKGSQSVTIRESAKIDGNIISPTVSLLEGATFNGKIDMSGEQAADAPEKPEVKEAPKQKAAPAVEETPADKPKGQKKTQAKADKKSASAA